jgi:hypothetical protein
VLRNSLRTSDEPGGSVSGLLVKAVEPTFADDFGAEETRWSKFTAELTRRIAAVIDKHELSRAKRNCEEG